jgi:hypothetical protein
MKVETVDVNIDKNCIEKNASTIKESKPAMPNTQLIFQQQQSTDSGVSSMTSPTDSTLSLNESSGSLLLSSSHGSKASVCDKSLKRKLRNTYNESSASSTNSEEATCVSGNNPDMTSSLTSMSNSQLKSPTQKRMRKSGGDQQTNASSAAKIGY